MEPSVSGLPAPFNDCWGISVNPGPRILSILACLMTLGCVSYAAVLTVTPPNTRRAALTHAETARTAKVVGQVATRFGLQPNPKIGALRQNSEASEEYGSVVIANYEVGRDRRTHGRVGVSVLVGKRADRLTVVIRDFDSPVATDFTTRLENSIREALAAEFPGSDISIQRQHVGPELGP